MARRNAKHEEGEAEVISAKKRAELLWSARYRFAKELGADHVFNDGYGEFYLHTIEGETGEDTPEKYRCNFYLIVLPEFVVQKKAMPFWAPRPISVSQKVAVYLRQGIDGKLFAGGAQLWLFRVKRVTEPTAAAQRAGVKSRYCDLMRTRVYNIEDELKGEAFPRPKDGGYGLDYNGDNETAKL